jgi:hypothetical protein
MSDRRKKMISKMMLSSPTEAEQTMMKLVVERICVDMCDFFKKFYGFEGPGAVIYVPEAENQDDSMFYLTVDALMNALNDFNSRDMDGPADVIKKAIARAESIDPENEALFIIQDKDQMSLIHYKYDADGNSLLRM